MRNVAPILGIGSYRGRLVCRPASALHLNARHLIPRYQALSHFTSVCRNALAARRFASFRSRLRCSVAVSCSALPLAFDARMVLTSPVQFCGHARTGPSDHLFHIVRGTSPRGGFPDQSRHAARATASQPRSSTKESGRGADARVLAASLSFARCLPASSRVGRCPSKIKGDAPASCPTSAFTITGGNF